MHAPSIKITERVNKKMEQVFHNLIPYSIEDTLAEWVLVVFSSLTLMYTVTGSNLTAWKTSPDMTLALVGNTKTRFYVHKHVLLLRLCINTGKAYSYFEKE